MAVDRFALIFTVVLCVCDGVSGGCAGGPMNSHVGHTAAAAAAAATRAEPRDAFSRSMMDSMAQMDRDMAGAPMTGDPDHDFAAMMIPHHRGAVDMARAYVAAGRDPVLLRLADEMLVTQGQEIDVMSRRLGASPGTARAVQPAPPAPAMQAADAGRDRVYTADQTSNTVSVIDPAADKLLGVIRLGDPVPSALSPLYRGQLLVHGMGFSPDHRTIAVVSIGSNSVTFIDTATNAVRGVTYVGRSPHEAFFCPDGHELWVAVRGEDYVAVIDALTLRETRRVHTANGPGMVLFRPDGAYAFVPSSFTPELDVIDTATYRVVARVPQASPFSPNLAVSRDGSEVWFTLKDSGKTQVMSGAPPFRITATLDTGPITNHVVLVDDAAGKFAYVSVGGENVVKVYRRGPTPTWVASIRTGDLPHGMWASGDGARVYVGLENQDAVVAIDTATNAVVATIPVGQQPQALCYVPGAAPDGDGRASLVPLGTAGDAAHLVLEDAAGTARGTVSVNALGPLDLLQAAITGLEPGHAYTLALVTERRPPYGHKEALATFKANAAGAQVVQTVGPLRRVVSSPPNPSGEPRADARFLIVSDADHDEVLLVQRVGQPPPPDGR